MESGPQAPSSQGQHFFEDFMILLDSSYDSWENEVLFLKTEAKVVDLWFDVFWAQVIQM